MILKVMAVQGEKRFGSHSAQAAGAGLRSAKEGPDAPKQAAQHGRSTQLSNQTADDRIRFKCLHCSQQVKASKDRGGRRFKCPGCGNIITVPGPLAVRESETSKSVDTSPQTAKDGKIADVTQKKKPGFFAKLIGSSEKRDERRAQKAEAKRSALELESERLRIGAELDQAIKLIGTYLGLMMAGQTKLVAEVRKQLDTLSPEAILTVAKDMSLEAAQRKLYARRSAGKKGDVDYDKCGQWLLQLMDDANERIRSRE